MLRRLAPTFAWWLVLIGAALILWNRLPDLARLPGLPGASTSRVAFDAWVCEDTQRRAEFAELQAFLRAREVADVVPAWQLTRIDAHYAARCDLPVFRMPPRELWDNVVAPLRLVREEVEPVVGPVQVLSSYRTPELNACAAGASRSNHLDFSALDLATQDRRRGEALYRELCAMHQRAGSASRMGLGAYYDLADPGFGGGRFHIDAGGYRSWGRGYRSASSPCRSFR